MRYVHQFLAIAVLFAFATCADPKAKERNAAGDSTPSALFGKHAHVVKVNGGHKHKGSGHLKFHELDFTHLYTHKNHTHEQAKEHAVNHKKSKAKKPTA
ncbi:hypothetical protein BC830DRAFT_1089557 [Chytriomyces sp. MP71]|nr:hypothetical protein BC830DRAFT_1089557 [Chytriomyces sp. MP71]